MPEQPHAEITEQLPAYALGCLDPAEAAAVAAHLDGCAACRAELAAYEDVTTRLAQAAPQLAPPAALKPRLLQRVQSPAHARRQAGGTVVAASPPAPWLRRAMAVWPVVSLLLVVGLATSNFLFWQQAGRQQAPTTAMRTVVLDGTSSAPQGTGTIVISGDGTQGALVVDALPPLDASHQYQLWLIKDGQRTSGGVFSVDAKGYAGLRVRSPEPLSDYSAFGVTVEPTGGSPGPTGPRVLGHNL